jgi:hypothetical protein
MHITNKKAVEMHTYAHKLLYHELLLQLNGHNCIFAA